MVCVWGARVLPERRPAPVLPPRAFFLKDHGAPRARETPLNTRSACIDGEHLYPVAQRERQAVSSLSPSARAHQGWGDVEICHGAPAQELGQIGDLMWNDPPLAQEVLEAAATRFSTAFHSANLDPCERGEQAGGQK